MFSSYTSDKGLITRIYRKLKKLNSPRINEPIKKWATELNELSQKKKFKWPKKHMKKYSSSLAIKEMQIKTTLRFHLAPVRISIIKNTTTKQVLVRMWGKRNPPYTIHCWWECNLFQPL
jgi:hypothetical protein